MNILLTFDYELFFNETDYSENEVLIGPTYMLDSIMSQYGINGTFFVDMSSIVRYEQLGMSSFPIMVKEQIETLYRRGNDIQLHTHPHWYNSYYERGKWNFDNQKYCLSSFSDAEVRSIVKHEKEQLEKMLKAHHEEYSCTAFRAGGFCVQPFKIMDSALFDAGIKVDSSILTGGFLDNGIHRYDFRKVPRQDRYSWTMLDENLHSINELPIGVIENKFLKFYIWKIMERLNTGELKGKPSDTKKNETQWLLKVRDRIKAAWNEPLLLCLDQIHYLAMIKALSFIEKKNKKASVVILMHPKFLTDSVLENFKKFIDEVKTNHSTWCFKTIRGVENDV